MLLESEKINLVALSLGTLFVGCFHKPMENEASPAHGRAPGGGRTKGEAWGVDGWIRPMGKNQGVWCVFDDNLVDASGLW